VQLSAIESQRQIDRRDQAQLNKWASTYWKIALRVLFQIELTSVADLHNVIADTGAMEGLDDIAAGQSHRANLHAMLHPNGTQPNTYSNLPTSLPLAGRGGGSMRMRGRPDIPPSPAPRHANVTPASPRYETW
jgi:hypothetical protein